MAQEPQEPHLPGEEEEVDYLFKAQMGVFKVFNAYWKHALAAFLAVLLTAGAYNLYIFWDTATLRKGTGAIADIDRKMPKPDPLSLYGLVPPDDLTDPDRKATLEEGARRYQDVADGTRSGASAEGFIKAGEAWARAGDREQAAAAYQNALAKKDTGVLGYAARTALAAYALEDGQVDAALDHYRALADYDEGLLSEQALIAMAGVHDSQGSADQVQATYDEFTSRYPESPRVIAFDGYDVVQAPPPVPTDLVVPDAPADAPADAPTEEPAQ